MAGAIRWPGTHRVVLCLNHLSQFARAVGLDIDLTANGLGVRSKRYSMLVEDGVVKSLNIEESPGQATVSAAAAMIEQL